MCDDFEEIDVDTIADWQNYTKSLLKALESKVSNLMYENQTELNMAEITDGDCYLGGSDWEVPLVEKNGDSFDYYVTGPGAPGLSKAVIPMEYRIEVMWLALQYLQSDGEDFEEYEDNED